MKHEGIEYTRPSLSATLAAIFFGNMFLNGVLAFAALTWAASHYGLLTHAYVVGAAYMVYILLSKARINGGRSSWVCRSDYFKALLAYFDMRVIAAPLPEQGGPYIVCCHPHAIHGIGMMQLVYEYSDLYKTPGWGQWRHRMVGLVASILFYLPGVREIFLLTGYRDVSRHTMEKALRQGNSVYLIVGGEAESLLSQPGTDKVVLAGKRRKGFVRMALSSGAPLVPCYMFRNTDTFNTSRFMMPFRKWLSKRFQICLPIFWGRWFSPTPLNVRMTVAFGPPVPLPAGYTIPRHAHSPAVPHEVVDAYHEAYIAALHQLFEQHKAAAGYPASRKLEVLEA